MTKMVKVNLDFSNKVYASMEAYARKHKMSVAGYLEFLFDSEYKKSQLKLKWGRLQSK